jgi:hypothetical protein
MKIILSIVFLSFALSVSAQTCQIPSLRGLKLGMAPQAVDSLFVVDNDKIIFDDVIYQLTFTRNKLVRINAEYFVKDARIGDFVRDFSAKTNLPQTWDFLADSEKLESLQKERSKLSISYSSEYPQIKQIDALIKEVKRSSPVLNCPNFSVTAYIVNNSPQVVLRLTNRSKSKEFQP